MVAANNREGSAGSGGIRTRIKQLFSFLREPVPEGSSPYKLVGALLKGICMVAALFVLPQAFLGLVIIISILGLLVVFVATLAGISVDPLTGSLAAMGGFGLLMGVFLFFVGLFGSLGALFILVLGNRAYRSWVRRRRDAPTRVRVTAAVLFLVSVLLGFPLVGLGTVQNIDFGLDTRIALTLPSIVVLSIAGLLFALAGEATKESGTQFQVVGGS